MNAKRLTTDEALLLQRYADGQANEVEEQAAKALLKERPAAEVYLAVLKELRLGVQLAMEEACEKAKWPDPEQWVDRALSQAGLIELELDELAPLLERFHDGEADDIEAAAILAMIEHREDVAAYLAELDGLSSSVRQAHDLTQVDLSNFWNELEKKLDDPENLPQFELEEHGVLLHRFHDGEVSDEEAALVQGWIERQDREVDAFLGALAELHLGVNAAIETAQEEAPLHEIWTGVEARLGEKAPEPERVVSLQERRAEKAKSTFWQRPLFAAVAAVALVAVGGLLGPRLMGPKQVIEKRTVVIFDSVEYSPGSSVMIHSPMLANHGAAEDEIPILWVMDDEEELENSLDEGEQPDLKPGEGKAPVKRHDFIPGPI